MQQVGHCLPPHYHMQLCESSSVFHSSHLLEGQRYTRCRGCWWSLPSFTLTSQCVPRRGREGGFNSNLLFHVPPLMSEKFCRTQPLLLTNCTELPLLSHPQLPIPWLRSCKGTGEGFCSTQSAPQGKSGCLENTQRGLVHLSFHSKKKSMQVYPQPFFISSAV